MNTDHNNITLRLSLEYMESLDSKTIQLYVQKLEEKGYSRDEIAAKLQSVGVFVQWAYDKDHLKYAQYQHLKDEIAKLYSKYSSPEGQQTPSFADLPSSSVWSADNQGRAPPTIDSTEKSLTGTSKEVVNSDSGFISFVLQKIPFFHSEVTSEGSIKSKPLYTQIKDLNPSASIYELQSHQRKLRNFSIGAFTIMILAILSLGIYQRFYSKTSNSFAYPATAQVATRVLSFQGRLLDSLGNPITTSTNMQFRLYDASTAGTTLYDSGTCAITPDQDGIHNVLIGSDCGAEIDASVFTENTEVWLGVKVGSDSEMTPRQRIANVPYAINAETLQGLPLGENASEVPFISQGGEMLIAAVNPTIQSSYASETFLLSSANAITIQSAGSGDVTLSATGSGEIKFLTGGSQVGVIENGGQWAIGAAVSSAQLDVGGGTATSIDGVDDLLVADDVEIDGDLYVEGSIDTAFTAGSIVFAGASGVLSQDNTNFFWDDTNNKLGIGNATPVGKLDINGAAIGKALAIFNETGDQAILTASASGTTRWTLSNNGNVTYSPSAFGASVTLYDVDTSLPNSNTGIVDAINDAYNAATGTGGLWTDSGTTTYLTTTTDDLVLGGSVPLSSAKLSIDGDADQIQLLIQGSGSQTENLLEFQNSGGTALSYITSEGKMYLPDGAWNSKSLTVGTGGYGIYGTAAGGYVDVGGYTVQYYGKVSSGLINLIQGTNVGSDQVLAVRAGSSTMSAPVLSVQNSSATNVAWFDYLGNLRLGTSAASNGALNVTNAFTGKALAIFNETGDQNIIAASASGTTVFTVGNNGSLDTAGTIQAGSSNITLTLATGYIDADSITLFAGGDGVGASSSSTGLEVQSNGLTLLQGCTDNYILKWDEATDTWNCEADATGGGGAWSDLSNPSGNLALSMAEYTTDFSWNTAATAAGIDAFSLDITNDASTDATTQRLLVLTNTDDAGSTGTTENLLVLDNADTNEAVTTAFSITDTGGGGFTTDISLQNGETIDNFTDGTIKFTGAIAATGTSDLQGDVSNSTGNLVLADTVDIGSASTGINITTAGVISDIDGNLVLADTVDIGSASTGINITTGGTISDIDGNVAINDTVDVTGDITATGDVAVNGGDVTSTAATVNLFNATPTTLNIGGAATTIELGAATGTTSVNNALTIDGNTTLGNASGDTVTANAAAWTFANATNFALATATNALSFATDLFVLDTTNDGIDITSAATTTDGLDLTFDSISTANATDLSFDGLTSGIGFNLTSTSTALTSGRLASFDWSPGSSTTATGDLFRINIGANGNVDSLLNITDAGTSIFKVAETGITTSVPASFTAAGDTSFAYDLLLTNQTSSYIKSNAPLYIQAGETFESNDLTLKSYNSGNLVFDAGGSTTSTGTISFYDSNIKGASVTTPIDFADSSTDIDTFRTNFTNENIIDALNEVYSAATGGAGGLWTDSGTTTYLTTTTDDLVLGGSAPLSSAKLSIDGDADQIQLIVQGNGTQTTSLAVFENSAGTDQFTISNTGDVVATGDLAVNGGDVTSSASTVNLFNTTPTTLNIGNAATTVEIGAATGTTSVNNALTVDGNTTLGNASGDTVTANAAAWTFANDTAVTLSGGVDGLNFDSNTLSIDATNDRIGIGTASPDGKLQVSGASLGKALAIFNETGDQDIIAASASGTTRFRVANDGAIYGGYLADISNTSYGIDPAGTSNFGGNSLKVTGGALLAADSGFVDIGTGTSDFIDGTDDLLVADDVEIDGDLYVQGGIDTTFTAGSVVFAGTNGLLTQDNSNFFWDDSSNELGIGTAAPAATLDILDTTEQLRLSYDASNTTSFTVDIAGDLTIAPSGGTSNITGDFTVSGHSSFGNGAGAYLEDSKVVKIVEDFTTAQDNWGLYIQPTFTYTGSHELYGSYNYSTADGQTSGYLYGSRTSANTANTTSLDQIIANYNDVSLSSGSTVTNTYGVKNEVNITSTAGATGAYGTHNTVYHNGAGALSAAYGTYNTITNISGTITNGYGLYSACNDATTCYAASLVATDVTPTTNYGLRVEASGAGTNNYGIYGANGDWILAADGSGVAGGTGAGGDFMLGASQDLELYHDGTNSYIMNNTGDLYIGDAATDDVILSANGGFVGIGDTTPSATLEIQDTTEQLRLSYDASNTTSFTVSSAGDLTLAPSGGDLNITGDVDISSQLAVGDNASITADQIVKITDTSVPVDTTDTYGINLSQTLTGSGTASAVHYGLYNAVIENSSSTGNVIHYGIYNQLENNNASIGSNSTWRNSYMYLQNNAAGLINSTDNYLATTQNASTGTIATSRNYYSKTTNSSTGTITNAYNFYADTPTNASGTVASSYGLYVNDQSVGTNTNAYGVYVAAQSGGSGDNIGLYIADADDYSLQLASTDGDAASGITFGTDTNLYRNAASSLYTDDAFTAVGNITTSGDLAVNGDDITSDGNLTLSATGYTRIGDTATPASATADDDLFVEGALEVDGVFYLDGTLDTTFTAGSVVFAGTNGVLAQDNASFFWDDTSNELGIGTAAPAATLDVLDTTEQLRLSYDVSNTTSFTVSSAGDLTLAPSGGDTSITGTLDVTSTLTAATGDAFYVNSEGHIEVGNPNGIFVDGNWDALIGSGSNAGIKLVNTDASSATEGAGFILYSYDGAAMASGDRLGFNLFGGGTGSGTTAHGGGIVAYADGTWTGTSAPTRLEFEVAPSGSTSRTTAMVIKENGDIGIGTSGPDAQLDSLSTAGEQLRLTYTDGSAYTGFTTSSSGDLTIDPTGGDIIVDANFLPNTDDTYTLGSDTARWADIFLGPETLHIGTSTTDEGTIGYTTSTNTLTFTNNYGDTDFTTSSDGFNFTLGGGAGDDFIVDTSTLVVESDNDRVGIGVTAPDATWLDIAAATTAKAQINLTTSAGVDVTTPNSGDLWWNGTNLYFYNGSTNKDLLAAGGSSPWTDGGSYVYTTAGEVLNLGGVTGTAYHAISDVGTSSHSLNSDDDLYIEGDFEVDGSTFLDGNLTLGNASAFNGAGLSDCDSATSILLWDSTTGLFSCGKDNDLVSLSSWSRTNLTASQTNLQLDRPVSALLPSAASEMRVPYAGNVVGISVAGSAARTNGSATFSVFINGATSGLNCTINATNTQYNYCTQASGTSTFSAGDYIDVRATTDLTWAPTTAEWVVEVWIEMDTGADLAELYNVEDTSIDSGHLVVIHPVLKDGVKKSEKAYDSGLMGVIATKPGLLLGENEVPDLNMSRAVALSGRVPVKVTSENGPIKVGDAITSSSIPGVGMKSTKAARVVGRAMTEWDNSDPNEIGVVTVFVEPAFDAGYILTDVLNSVNNLQDQLTELTKNSSIALTDGSKVAGKVVIQTIDSLIIQTENLVAQTITATNATIDTLIVDKIVGTSIQTNNLTADKAIVNDLESDNIQAQTLKAEGFESKDATISGTLVADNIDSENIRSLRDRLEKVANEQSDVIVNSDELEADVANVRKLIDELNKQDVETTDTYMKTIDSVTLDPGTIESVTGSQEAPMQLSKLMVTGTATFTSATVEDAFSVGDVFIKGNQVAALAHELKLDAFDQVSIMNGGVIVDNNGTLTAKGEVIAEKGVRSNSLSPINAGDDLEVRLGAKSPSGKDESSLKVVDTLGNTVAEVNASGSATFADLSLDKYTYASNSAIIASQDNFKYSGIYAPAIETNASVTGNAVIPSGNDDIIIYNEKIKKDTLIYVTATSSTGNRSLFISEQKDCTDVKPSKTSDSKECKSYFRVAIDSAYTKDVTFNWWLVN